MYKAGEGLLCEDLVDDLCMFALSLSRRRPDALAWKAACVTTTIRSGSSCISSTLLYSCSRAHHGNTETSLYKDFTQRRCVYLFPMSSSDCFTAKGVEHFPLPVPFIISFPGNFFLLVVYLNNGKGRCFHGLTSLCEQILKSSLFTITSK